MRLLFIITDYGSFNNFLTELSEVIIDDQSNELHIICSENKVINVNDKKRIWPNNIHFHFINIPRGLNMFKQLKVAYRINKIIKLLKPDIIHTHFTTATFPATIFRVTNLTYWCTIHGLGMNSTTGLRKLMFSLIEHFSFRKVNKIILLNNTDFDFLIRKYPNKVIKYQCLGMGCDIAKFNPERFPIELKNNLRKELNIPLDSKVISFTGRFVEFKGFNIVIKTFMRLCEIQSSQYRLILMGGIDPIHSTGLTPEEDQFYKKSKDIIHIGFTNEVEKYLAISDVFLFPSKKEGLPTCVLESLAMGVPVITYDARGNNDIIKDGYNGILLPATRFISNEEEPFVLAVKSLINDSTLYSHLERNAKNERLQYSRNNFVNESIELYLNLLCKDVN